MRSRAVLVVVLGLITLPLCAQSNDVAVWFGASRVGSTDVEGTDIRFDRGNAVGASLNHYWSNHLSAELAVFAVRHDGALRVGGVNAFDVGRLRMIPITAMVQWHHDRMGRIDPYLGGGLTYVKTDNLHSSDLDAAGVGRVRVKSRIGWTAGAGLSYSVAHSLAIGADARYIGYRPESGSGSDTVKLELSPVLYSLGLRWRF
jgi:outer membrane protein W